MEARRGDTPLFIVETQSAMIELLARSRDDISGKIGAAQALRLLRWKLADLRSGKVAIDELVVSQRLSRELSEYKALSPVARALQQLQAVGKDLRPGQQVRFVFTRGKPGVYAWDLPNPPDPRSLDLERYSTLLLRAAFTVLEPFGVEESQLSGLTQKQSAYQLRFRRQSKQPDVKRSALPSLSALDAIMVRAKPQLQHARDPAAVSARRPGLTSSPSTAEAKSAHSTADKPIEL